MTMRTIATAFAGALLLSACGGDGDGDDQATPTTVAVLEASTTSEAPTTTAAPTTSAAPTTEASVDLTEFCADSGRFWESANVGNLIDLGNGGAVEAMFAEMAVRLEPALRSAPDAENAAPVLAMADTLTNLDAALQPFDYDWVTWSDSAAYADSIADVDSFITIVEALEGFLNTQCVIDAAALEANSEALALDISAAN